nr:hypothetical protein [uncultured Agathobaculum sp.]
MDRTKNMCVPPEFTADMISDIVADVVKKSNRRDDLEEIIGDYDLDRLRDLVQADRDGRCVVLPKDGMIYFHEESIDGDERWVGNWPIKDVLLKCGFGIESLTYSIEDVGRKIYFSSEAAEAALKGEQHDT